MKRTITLAQVGFPFPIRAVQSWMRLTLAIGLACLLSSCVCLHQENSDGTFEGLDQALARTASTNATLRVLAVHGMGHHDAGWASNLVARLASQLRLSHVPGRDGSTNFQRSGHTFGTLRVQEFTGVALQVSAPCRLRLYELTWSPIVDAWKSNKFGNDLAHAGERVWVNRYLKKELVNHRLADPVLYVGAYQQHMQYPIMRALTYLSEDGSQPNDEAAFITFSLGSYMTFDTLTRMSRGYKIMGEAPYRTDAVNQLIDQTTHFFMLANQLPLLELSDVSNPPPATHRVEMTARPTAEALAKTNDLPGLKGFLQQRERIRQHPNRIPSKEPKWKLAIVAMSDPNDLLSYPLDAADVADSGAIDISVRNVTLNVARTAWFGVIANPLKAHSGHDRDLQVVRFIAHGHP